MLPNKEAKYEPKGEHVYVAGSGKKGLLYIPDIFGPHPNAYQVADILAGRGFLVVMPDFFHGNHWDINDFPPSDKEKFGEWIGQLNYDALKPRIKQGITLLKGLGAKSVGAVGFCWGGGIAFNALAEGLVKSAASPHPSMVTPGLLRKAKGPICLLPTLDDGDMVFCKEAADETGHKVVYNYFGDMHHGFCAARANFDNELNQTRANEAIDIMTNFFNETL